MTKVVPYQGGACPTITFFTIRYSLFVTSPEHGRRIRYSRNPIFSSACPAKTWRSRGPLGRVHLCLTLTPVVRDYVIIFISGSAPASLPQYLNLVLLCALSFRAEPKAQSRNLDYMRLKLIFGSGLCRMSDRPARGVFSIIFSPQFYWGFSFPQIYCRLFAIHL